MDSAATGPSDRHSDGARSPALRRAGNSGRRAGAGGGSVTPLRALPVGRGRASGVPLARAEQSTPQRWPGNLPHPVTSFIGREQEIAEVKRLLGMTRLLTLTGTGGVGKTRLGHAVAAGMLDPSATRSTSSGYGSGQAPSVTHSTSSGHGSGTSTRHLAAGAGQAHPDGVWLVELAALADARLVPQTVAKVVGVREEAGRSIEASLADALRAERLLLVLDNCEHLIDACAALADSLLRACPDLRILATSRQPMGIAGETTLRVPSLSLPTTADGRWTIDEGPPVSGGDRPARPEPAEGSTVGRPPESEAVRLFVERAQAAVPTFTLTDRNVLAVEQICRRLDGIPLAIELAAARVAVISPDQLAARLGDRFGLLTGGSRTALPRYRTLRALLDWSHELLEVRERVLLRRLAVFAGGWTLEAAEAVCGFAAGDRGRGIGDRDEAAESSSLSRIPHPLSPHDVLDLLSGLVAKSLVVTGEQAGEVRYRFLETLREYAAERLRESGEEEMLRRRHRDWFVALAEQAEPELVGPHQEVWLDRLDRERENLRAAKRWADARGAPETVVRLGAALWQLWMARADAAEAREWIDAIVPLARQIPPTPSLARALHGAGVLAGALADFPTCRSLLEDGLAVARQLGDRQALATLLDSLGRQAFVEGRYPESRALLNEGLAILRELDDRRGQARALSHLGFLDYLEDRQASARAIYQEGLELAREVGGPGEAAEFLDNLGRTFHAEGDLDAAARTYQEAVTLLREIGHGGWLAMVLNNLGNVMTLRGDLEAARSLLREALQLARRMGNRRRLAFALAAVATQAAVEGQAELAVRTEAAAFAAAEAMGAVLARPAHRLSAERLERAHEALGAPASAAAVAAGRALTLEQAVEEALDWLSETESSAQVGTLSARGEPPQVLTVPAIPADNAPHGGVGVTRREQEVAALIARGFTNRQIASELVITEGTAANHVKHILARLDFDSRVQIAAWAIEHGLYQHAPA